uniref:Gustatory receptor n=1 Tax=Ditylenchus dipsaci TaxID=166011 RepID=A0A915D7X3_9BILA
MAVTHVSPPVDKTFIRKVLEIARILVPHVGLNILLLSYITFGALVFTFLEAENELQSRKEKLHRILEVYKSIVHETAEICRISSEDMPAISLTMIEQRMRPLLSMLSHTHEYDERLARQAQMWSESEQELTTKWTFAAASLYALTVISSTVDIDQEELEHRKLEEKKPRRVSFENKEQRVQLPMLSYFVLVIGYCAIGSLLFNAWEKGAICATLKKTFTKLHYFGRKIRGAGRGFANVSDDIREAIKIMKIMTALKKTRPDKERITLEDLKRFLEVQEQLLKQPFVPCNVHIFKWIEDSYAQYFDQDEICLADNLLDKPVIISSCVSDVS